MAATVRVQTVLFQTPSRTCARLMAAMEACAAVAVAEGSAARVTLAIGDCTPTAGVDARLRDQLSRDSTLAVSWTLFGQNLGHGAAQNRLSAGAGEDIVLFANPDVYPAPGALHALLTALVDPGVGIVEGRQLPVEIPKVVDATTGDTPWCTACFAAMELPLFARLGGFDEAFFLHGDDVDLSWRIRAEGLRAVYVPAAAVYHPRRIEPSGYANSNDGAAHHMHLADLLRAWKARRPDLVDELLARGEASGDSWDASANAEFRRRRNEGGLGEPYPFDASPFVTDAGFRRF